MRRQGSASSGLRVEELTSAVEPAWESFLRERSESAGMVAVAPDVWPGTCIDQLVRKSYLELTKWSTRSVMPPPTRTATGLETATVR